MSNNTYWGSIYSVLEFSFLIVDDVVSCALCLEEHFEQEMALPLKRGRNFTTPAQVSQDANHTVLEVILSKENNGITKPQIRHETKLADTIIKTNPLIYLNCKTR